MPGALRILIAAHALRGPGGTETYAVTVAHQLRRLGHDVTLAAMELGAVSDVARAEGLRVADEPHGDGEYDAILVNDAVVAGPLSERHPEARMVHVAHSDLYEHQLPVAVQGVVDAVVVMSERLERCIRATALDAPIVRLRQPIDVERFRPHSPIRAVPRRALLLSNYLHGDRRDALVEAWRAEGVECVELGTPTEVRLDVVAAIADADIVVGKGRVALEGMACGRAVYLHDMFGTDGWVTPERYPAMEADAFAGQACAGSRTVHDLRGYDASMGPANHEIARRHHSARRHAAALVEVLAGPASARPAPGAAEEVSRLAGMRWADEQRLFELRSEVAAVRERLLAAEDRRDQLAASLRRAETLLATRRAQAGIAAGRAADRLRGRG
jgi:hypothetical protein